MSRSLAPILRLRSYLAMDSTGPDDAVLERALSKINRLERRVADLVERLEGETAKPKDLLDEIARLRAQIDDQGDMHDDPLDADGLCRLCGH